jgi:hypothetical protein
MTHTITSSLQDLGPWRRSCQKAMFSVGGGAGMVVGQMAKFLLSDVNGYESHTGRDKPECV